MKTKRMLLIITAVITALAGGVFFAWSCSVTPGLKLLGDKEYFTAFREMNRAIQNPVFFLCFFGAALLLPICAWKHYATPIFWMLLAASLSYLLGVIGVTIFGNIPINQTIETIDLALPVDELHQKRITIETSWNRFNTIRTCASVVSIIMVVLACTKYGSK
jgi:uncharacterized membrane protein